MSIAYRAGFLQRLSRIINIPSFPTATSFDAPSAEHQEVEVLSDKAKKELVSSIKSLQTYQINTREPNERRKRLFKLASWRQQNLANDIGYSAKLKKIDQLINKNQTLLTDIAAHGASKFNLKFSDLQNITTTNNLNNNYRVIESFGHFVRDWCKEGEIEQKPLLDYISSNLDVLVPAEERAKTCIIVPGSGLGRIAHEISLLGAEKNQQFASVQAIEFSWLMHLCNDFIYQDKSSVDVSQYELYPFIHTNSNHTSTSKQFRSTILQRSLVKPSNLSINYGDFRYFKVPDFSQYENVVVITAFFLDTAENVMDYLDRINHLTTPSRSNSIKKGYWMNMGPLKYGSAAQMEFNLEEMRSIRDKLGWIDLNENSYDYKYTKSGYDLRLKDTTDKKLVGYLTDLQGLWQGYYGMGMWCSERKENK